MAAMSHHLLDFADGFGGIEILRARLGAIHDGMASIQAKWIFEIIEALAGRLVPAVDYPPKGRSSAAGPNTDRCSTNSWTAGGTAGAQNARRGSIDLFLILFGLQALRSGGGGVRVCSQGLIDAY